MNYNLIKNKFLIIDTDVLINTSKYLKFYDRVFEKLFENEAVLLLDDFVRFEFLRKAKNNKEFLELNEFLNTLLGIKG